MIRDIFENQVGFMEGTFFSELFGYDITVWYEKDIPLAYIEKNIEYFNNLDQEIVLNICSALKRYYEFYQDEYPDVCEECEYIHGDVLKNYEVDPKSILECIHLGTYEFNKCKTEDEDIPVLNLGGDCDWTGDSGVRIAAKNNQLLFVGSWCNLNLWSTVSRHIFDSMFNFANQDSSDE